MAPIARLYILRMIANRAAAKSVIRWFAGSAPLLRAASGPIMLVAAIARSGVIEQHRTQLIEIGCRHGRIRRS